MSDNLYHPVDCALHSRYELAIMQRTPLSLQWQDEQGQQRQAVLLPEDLTCDARMEYLLARDASGEILRLRLDRIHDVNFVAVTE